MNSLLSPLTGDHHAETTCKTTKTTTKTMSENKKEDAIISYLTKCCHLLVQKKLPLTLSGAGFPTPISYFPLLVRWEKTRRVAVVEINSDEKFFDDLKQPDCTWELLQETINRFISEGGKIGKWKFEKSVGFPSSDKKYAISASFCLTNISRLDEMKEKANQLNVDLINYFQLYQDAKEQLTKLLAEMDSVYTQEKIS